MCDHIKAKVVCTRINVDLRRAVALVSCPEYKFVGVETMVFTPDIGLLTELTRVHFRGEHLASEQT